ncbi:xylose repressor [Enterococcus faecalis]|uniref:ROK family transcriptional regulator n=1 Tax=Enterococcus faecalis TaxID=1351 RepID=UPI00244D901E|nr:ROK family transcriptional regulator [Enterococcus faecalis]BDX51183.1 xylose repressor [Enterococcus faecalis]GMC18354.1 xylose repressor [Enterococcus faecalis]
MISSKYTIREQNEAQILNQIIKHREISRAELSKITSLNKASVSSITNKLINDGFIIEKRIGEATNRGRKPIMLTFNGSSSALVIAIDLGYNYIDGALASLDGKEIHKVQLIDTYVNKKNVQDLIHKVFNQLTSDCPHTHYGIVGMTIALQGQVLNNKIISTSYNDLAEINLVEMLNQEYNFPVFLQNEANLSALGEYTFSSDIENLASISLHSGIGVGLVKNGKLDVGNKGYAGQLGHTILFPNGRKCTCGNHGCLEKYCSTQVIYHEISKEKNLNKINSDVVSILYNNKESKVVKMIEQYAYYLSIGVNNAIMLYAPELVIFNSPLTKKIPDIINIIQRNLNNQFTKDVLVINSPIEWNPVISGAISLSIQKFLNIEQLKLGKLNKI